MTTMEHKNPYVKYYTIFCDIDGTIFKYRKFNTYLSTKPEPVLSVVNELQRLEKEGHTIVLTSARPENLRFHTTNELMENNVPCHQLVLGLARGTRFLVNDMEDPNKPRAVSLNIVRDQGFSESDKEKFAFN